MREIVLGLRELGARVTFLPDNHDKPQPFVHELQQAGVEVLYGDFQERDVLRQAQKTLRLAILSRPTVAWRYLYLLREFAPYARIVYDTVDLHFVREARRAEHDGDPTIGRLSESFREMELGLIRSADETITVSEEERQIILGDVPNALTSVIPTMHATVEDVARAEGRRGIVFVGNFQHLPNVSAAVRLVRDILPLVRQALPDVPVYVIGPNAPKSVTELADIRGVEVLGFVEDLGPYLQRCRAMLAPLAFGAGVKGKLTQSLASGLPVVTTTIGAEGLDGRPGEDLFIADADADAAAAVVLLHNDDARWTTMSEAGRRLAAERFSPAVARTVLSEMLERLTEAQAR
jgi:glycosyltransferase involved in cell wall biosynthesis